MNDLDVAEQILKSKDCNFVLVKNSHPMVVSNDHGLKKPLEIASTSPHAADGAAVADRIVGKAAALIYVFLKVRSVFARTISQEGYNILKKHLVEAKMDMIIPRIIGKDGEHICIFERAVQNVNDPKEANTILNKIITQK
jgi:hypothetical protein